MNNDQNSGDNANEKPKSMETKSDRPQGLVAFGHVDVNASAKDLNVDMDALPVLPVRDMVLFPSVVAPISLGRESSLAVAEYASANNAAVALICQKSPDTERPELDDLYKYGVTVRVMKAFTLPDGTKTALVSAIDKIKIMGPGATTPLPGIMTIKAKVIKDRMPARDDKEFACVVGEIHSQIRHLLEGGDEQSSDFIMNLSNLENPLEIINFICSNAPLTTEEKEEMLKMIRLKDRAFALMSHLSVSEQMASLLNVIKERTQRSLSDAQRETVLHHQLEAIRNELYGDAHDDLTALRRRADEMKWPGEAAAMFNREWDKLNRLAPNSPDYAVARSYLELLLELPWGKIDPLTTTLSGAREILDADHYGLEKVKERIIEQLAILMNTPEGRAPIICLVGAPGVGKTSLGQSIAKALGRKYQRVSLGGLHDEAELRGHRRTYIGSMPGRIIDALRRAGSANPVMLLDEIDKTGGDYKGDPQAALLEVLDPEQNSHFHDNYVDVDFDLSKVLFIATANSISTISQPLLDRMEVIDISGYLQEEKIEIARRHLLSRLRSDNALTPEEIDLTPEAIAAIIDGYTSESGVRQLEKKLAAIIRKVVVAKVDDKEWPRTIGPADLGALLGAPIFNPERYEGNDYPGVVTGLAWTSAGGTILYIEASATIAKGPSLTLTGNLGNVMKESARIALQWVKANAPALGIDPEVMERLALHLHVPEGAIPKDGPSAGITMATAIVSAITRRKVGSRIAMTGEITLRGRVLPVGGIKEKILAAKRAGVTDIILSDQNRKDVEEIPAMYLSGLEFHYVADTAEVISLALTDERAGDPLSVPAGSEAGSDA